MKRMDGKKIGMQRRELLLLGIPALFLIAIAVLLFRLEWQANLILEKTPPDTLVGEAAQMLSTLVFSQFLLSCFLLALLIVLLAILFHRTQSLRTETLERKRADQNLDRLFAAVDEAMLCIGQDGRIIRSNPSAWALFGASEEALGWKAGASLFADNGSDFDFASRIRAVLEDGEDLRCEWWCICIDKSRSFEADVSLRRLSISAQSQVLMIVRDISAGKAVERARDQVEGRFLAQQAHLEAERGKRVRELEAVQAQLRKQNLALTEVNRERMEAGERLHEQIERLARAQEEIAAVGERYRLVAEGANDIIWDWDARTKRLHLNDRFYELLGYDRAVDVISYEAWRSLIHPDDRVQAYASYHEHLLGNTPRVVSEYRMRRKDGEYRWFFASGKLILGADGRIVRYAGSLTDIGDLKRQEAIIAELAYTDSLTGLPNRTSMLSVLESRLDRDSTAGGALLLVDLDNFKTINDAFGHAYGDRLLKAIAERLNMICATTDPNPDMDLQTIVSRFGGDEFMLVMDRNGGRQPGQLADHILQGMLEPFLLEGKFIHVSCSIGITCFPEDGTLSGGLIKNADTALFRAKDAGRKCWVAYSPEMGFEAARRMDMEAELRKALGADEFRMVFQPQVDIAHMHIMGYEALIRWNNPHFGQVPPDRFIPMAEETGLILDIGAWVIRESCRFAASLPQSGQRNFCVSINVSPLQFSHGNLEEQLREAVRQNGIPPSMIGVEMTETMLMEDFDRIVDCLQTLRAEGFRIYLDDFGTGYSSLNYLKNLPIDVLKIDKSFVNGILEHEAERSLLRSIIGMAHSLNLSVVAEGVETEAQRQYLDTIQCNYMQGYLFSRPVPPDEAIALLRGQLEENGTEMD